MNQKDASKLAIMICVTVFLSTVSLSGCTTQNNQNTGVVDLSKFLGTWVGTLEITTFGHNSSNITQLTFMENVVAVTMASEQGTYTMNYSYSVDGNTLVLEPKFDRTGGSGSYNGQPHNNSHQWNNGTYPPNGTWPPNGTLPYGQSPNGGQYPGGERPSMSLSFVYSFNETQDILYLNGDQFTKT